MKYSSMVIAAALAVSGMAYATDEKAQRPMIAMDRQQRSSVLAISSRPIRMNPSKDKFIAECMQPRNQGPASGQC